MGDHFRVILAVLAALEGLLERLGLVLGCLEVILDGLEGILGASWRSGKRLGNVLGGLRGVLEASWRVLETSWRCLGGVLGHLGGILDVSWGKCRKNVEGSLFFGRVLKAKMEAKIVKIRV